MDDELTINTDFAELVDDDGQLSTVLLTQDTIDQRRLAGAEKAGNDGRGNAGIGFRHDCGLRWGAEIAGIRLPPRSPSRSLRYFAIAGTRLAGSPPGVGTTVLVMAAMPCSIMTLRLGGGNLSPRSSS